MNSTKIPLTATAKAAGMAAALIFGLTLSAGGAAAHARSAGPDATPVTHPQPEQRCDKDQDAIEATLETAAKQVQSAFVTNHLAIEQLREKAGGRDKAARDLLKQADSQLKEIRATAMTALKAASDGTTNCTALDTAAIDATVAQATGDLDAVVTDVTAAVAALPAIDPKADLENEDETDEASDADHETKSEDHETKTAERSGDRSGEKSTVRASTTSKGHSNH